MPAGADIHRIADGGPAGRRDTGLETAMSGILASYGYRVRRNVTLQGRSGAACRIGMLAEYRAPLHTDMILIHCRAGRGDRPAGEEDLMGQLLIRRDAGLGHIIIATTAGFTDGCLKAAARYGNVSLWDGERVAALSGKVADGADAAPSFISPAVSEARAARCARSRARKMSGNLFRRRPRVRVESVRLVSYPYHNVLYHDTMVERKGILSRTESVRRMPREVSVDARLNIITVPERGASYLLSFMAGLEKADYAILRSAGKGMLITQRGLEGTGLPKSEYAERLSELHRRGIVMRPSMSGRPVHKVAVRIPRSVRSLPQAYSGRIGREPVGVPVEPVISPRDAMRCAEAFGGRPDGARTVYYPYYDVRYADADGASYNDVIDGMTCKIQPELRKTMMDWKPPGEALQRAPGPEGAEVGDAGATGAAGMDDFLHDDEGYSDNLPPIRDAGEPAGSASCRVSGREACGGQDGESHAGGPSGAGRAAGDKARRAIPPAGGQTEHDEMSSIGWDS